MKADALGDHGAFCGSIDRVAPQVLKAWNELAEKAPDRAEIVAFLAHWRLDAPGLEWLADGLYGSVRAPTGDPWPGPRFPDFSLPIPAIFVPTHDMAPVVLTWEPGDTAESVAAFRQRAKDEIETYISRVQAWMRERNIEMPRAERDGGKLPTGNRRWDLLVRYLVLGEPYERIADRYDVAWATVGEHVRNLANRLGIALKANEDP